VAQWAAHLTHNRWMPVRRELEPHQKTVASLSKKLLTSLLSTGWFQEQIRARFT